MVYYHRITAGTVIQTRLITTVTAGTGIACEVILQPHDFFTLVERGCELTSDTVDGLLFFSGLKKQPNFLLINEL